MKFETNQNVTNDKNIQDVSIFGLDLIPEGDVYILGKTWDMLDPKTKFSFHAVSSH